MRPRWQKIISDLFSHKVRSLLVIASIAVGLFAIGMITNAYVILARDIRTGYQALNPANIQIRADLFDEEFVEHVRNIPGVAEAEGAWNTGLQVYTAFGEWRPISIKAQDISRGEEDLIARPTLLEGSWPPDDKEIVLDINRLEDAGVGLGDALEIKLPSGIIRRLTVTGVVQDQTIGSASGEGGFFLSEIQGYVDFDTLAWLEQPEGYNTLYVTVAEGGEDRGAIRALADELVAEFEHNGHRTGGALVRLSEEHPNLNYVDAMVAVIFLLGFLVVFLSGFLITNTFSALLNQQVEQIGVMKTIGGSRTQIIGLYMVLILIFSLIALVVAIPTSIRAAYAFLDYLAEQINFRVLDYRPVPAAIILQAIIALLVPQIAGSRPILQGTRISVREALSGPAAEQLEDNGFVYRQLTKIRRLSRPALISLRNTLRNRSRLLLTLLTLALGGAIFIATFNVSNSIQSYVDRLAQYFQADVNLTFDRPYRLERVRRDVLQVPGVAAVEGWSGALAQIFSESGEAGETVQVLGPPAGSALIEPLLFEGRWLEPGDENAIVLSEIFKDTFPGLQVGDTLRLRIGQKDSDWVVTGFFQFAGPSSGLVAYTHYEQLSRQTGTYGSATSYRIVASGEALTQEQQDELGGRVEAHLSGLGYEIRDVDAGKSLQENTSQGLLILTTFLLIMSFLMAAVGSIGLMGTMSLNVMERTREIGVMRAIGGSNRAISSIVLLEGVLIGLISWLLASLAALPISKQLADVMFQIIFDRNATLDFTPTGNLIWLGVVLVLSVLASLLPAYHATRLTIREVLAYE